MGRRGKPDPEARGWSGLPSKPGRPLCLLGVAAAVTAWLVIASSWLLNRDWFTFTRDAFSDLGGPGARYPWVYNVGLIIVGVMVVLLTPCPYRLAGHKLEVFGSGLLFTAGLFLALLGVYPAGTRPHVFISTWFFIQMDMALIALSLGAFKATGDRLALLAALASIAGFPVYLAVEAAAGWPSAAASEAYGIAVIDVAVALFTVNYLGRAPGRLAPDSPSRPSA